MGACSVKTGDRASLTPQRSGVKSYATSTGLGSRDLLGKAKGKSEKAPLLQSHGDAKGDNVSMKESNSSSIIIQLVVIVLSIIGTLMLFINPRFDDLHRAVDRLDSRVEALGSRLDGQVGALDSQLDGLSRDFVRLETKLDAIGNMIVVALGDGGLATDDLAAIWERALAE